MNYRNMPPEVHKLSTVPAEWTRQEWFNYSQLGLGPDHVPMLIEIVRNSPEFWNDNVDDAEYYVPMHAWRALVQMHAEEAISTLVKALDWIDEVDSELVQEEMPEALGRMGVSAGPQLSDYLFNTKKSLWGRIAAAEGVTLIAERNPEYRKDAVFILTKALDRFEEEEGLFNGFIINCLAKLSATEAAPLVEAAYRADRVDESILGDWEDFQVYTGMLQQRLTPRHQNQMLQSAFADGVLQDRLTVGGEFLHDEPAPEEQQFRELERKAEKKDKKKRKEAKSKRKKNSKKK